MIVINSSTRQFNIPGADMTFGVEADAGSERKYFQCPRYVGNKLDIASSFVRINYRNANGEIDSYLVEDLTVDGDNVTFSWELSPKVTAYKGQLRFVMCVVGPDTKVAWHTTLGTGIVLEGLEPDYTMIQAGTADVVAQLIALTERQSVAVENKGAEWVRNVQSEGTDQIIAVQTAGAEARAAAVAEIEAKGVNVRESIPEDYTSLENTVDGLVRGRAGAIVCEAAGETVTVSDSSNLPMQGLRVFGKTTQATTTGAQLTPYPYFNGNKTYNGITWTINPDGSVKAKGTATATSPLYFTNSTHELAPGQYTVSGSVNGVTVRIDSTIRETGKWKAGVAISKNGQPVTFTVTEEDNATYFYTLYASVENGNTVDVTIYPMLNAGASALPWEIYTGGKPSPSPDYPQELVSLEPVVSVCGKNLFDGKLEIGAINANSGTLYYIENESRMVNYIPVTPGVPIYIKREDTEGAIKPRFYDRDYNYLGTGTGNLKLISGYSDANPMNDGTGECCISIINEAVSYMKICVASVNLENHYMVSVVDAEYEESPGNQTLPLTHTLPGIPVTSGGNYTDSDGQQWICDEVDLERGVYVQRVANRRVLSSDTWSSDESAGRYWINADDFYDVADAVVCTHFVKADGWANHMSTDGTVILYRDASWSYGRLSFKVGNITSLDNWKQFLDNNEVYAIYELATPVETALSENEIAAYRAMHSNYPNTTVLNDAGAHMVVKYAADTKLYIDNKIAALVGG